MMQSISEMMLQKNPKGRSLFLQMTSSGTGQATAATSMVGTPVSLAVNISDRKTLNKDKLATAGSKQH